MPATIPLSSQKRLLRLISAQTDMKLASDAFQQFMVAKDDDARHHFFLSMVMAYGRPFTENHGIGSLLSEYPSFPDFPDADMNLRHKRMMDLRNKLLGHSSIEGIKVWLLAPVAISPASGGKAVGYGYAVAKLVFTEPGFVFELHDIVRVLANRLDGDIRMVAKKIGSNYLKTGEMYLLDTGKKPFKWTL